MGYETVGILESGGYTAAAGSCLSSRYAVVARDAELVEIPPLPDGWNRLPLSHTRCKNFRFAVGAFGSPFPSANPE